MEDKLIRVAIESPFAGEVEKNIAYAKACVNDCLLRGEAPYASHLFFTQPGLLNDDDPQERMLGIMAGKEWEKAAKYTVVYVDRGISKGMELGIKLCSEADRKVIYRSLGNDWLTEDGQKIIKELKMSS